MKVDFHDFKKHLSFPPNPPPVRLQRTVTLCWGNPSTMHTCCCTLPGSCSTVTQVGLTKSGHLSGVVHNQLTPLSWDYQGSVLTMTSTRLAVDSNNQIYEMEIVQRLNIELIDDDNAMWMSWVSLTVDGQQSSQMSDGCFLMMKQSTASTPDEFYTQSLKYEDDRPNWC